MVIGPIYPKQTNKVLNSVNNPQAETAMPTSALYFQGQVVCMSGATRNGVVCGTISNPSASQTPTGGPLLLDQIYATFDGCEGDSGGAVTVGATWAGIFSTLVGTRYTITGGDGGSLECGTESFSSKLTASNLYWYLGMDGMMTWT